MNLRTHFKIRVRLIKDKKLLSFRIFTIRFSEMRKRFLLERVKNYFDKIKFEKGLVCNIKVYYCSEKYTNEGNYNNHKELLNAFNCFTEQELLKEEWDRVLIPPSTPSSASLENLKRMRMLKRIKVPAKKKSSKFVKNLGSEK